MDTKKIYSIVGAVLVAVIIIVILLPESDPLSEGAANPATGEMPPGHPDTDQMGSGERQIGAVKSSFMDEYKRLQAKVGQQPESDTSDVLVYARMLLDAHMAADALPLLQRYHRAAPDNIPVMLDLSVAFSETKQIDEATDMVHKVLAKDPENTTAMYNIGALYALHGQTVKAREAWEKLIRKHPKTPDAQRAMQFIGDLDKDETN